MLWRGRRAYDGVILEVFAINHLFAPSAVLHVTAHKAVLASMEAAIANGSWSDHTCREAEVACDARRGDCGAIICPEEAVGRLVTGAIRPHGPQPRVVWLADLCGTKEAVA